MTSTNISANNSARGYIDPPLDAQTGNQPIAPDVSYVGRINQARPAAQPAAVKACAVAEPAALSPAVAPAAAVPSTPKQGSTHRESPAQDSCAVSCAAPAIRREYPLSRGVDVRVSGHKLEKLLQNLEKRGVYPRDVRREGLRALLMRLNYADIKDFRAACVELNLDISYEKPVGITHSLLRLKRRAALPICAAVCALMLGLVATRVWRVEVDAPAPVYAEVVETLSSLGVNPGAAKSELDLKSLETAISAAVPDVKFCQARIRGVTFVLTAQQTDAAPELISLNPPGGLYARCDAVIERIQVLSGKAVVERGDTVRAGDLLISGEEQSTREATAPIKAMGIVTGRVWYEGRSEVALSDTVLERTGRTRTRRALQLFGMEFIINPSESWSVCDREISEQYIGGLFLPLRVETVRYYELGETTRELDINKAKELAGEEALQNALKKCPDNATVIDKWTEYSIIEGNTIQARYVLEVEETIQCGG